MFIVTFKSIVNNVEYLPPLRSLALMLNWNMLLFIVPTIFYKAVHHIMKIFLEEGIEHGKS